MMFDGIKNLALIAAAGGVLTSCTVANRIDADRDKWRVRAHAAEKSAKSWEASYHYVVKLRTQEAKDAQDALSSVRQACDAHITAVRQQEAALRRALNRPVKYDKAGCPVRTTILAAELGLR